MKRNFWQTYWVLILIGWSVCFQAAHASTQQDETEIVRVQQSLHLAEYIGGDYAGAVQGGKVISPTEYAEQQEFAGRLSVFCAALSPDLARKAKALHDAVAQKADAEQITKLATILQTTLKADYPNAVKINVQPDLAAAKQQYAENCAACHGVSGKGDGAAGAQMMPRPADFYAPERAFKSIFSYYNTISHGVNGTGMPAFGEKLDEKARWSLAFYVMQFQLSPASDQQITDLSKYPNLNTAQKLVEITPITFKANNDQAGLTAFSKLVAMPAPVFAAQNGKQNSSLKLARDQLDASVQAAQTKNWDKAISLALAAYLDGIEPIEPQLASRAPALKNRIEAAMLAYRESIQNKLSLDEIQSRAEAAKVVTRTIESALQTRTASAASSMVSSFAILAREGLEAILVLAVMLAFVRKSGQTQAARWVHGGWIAALIFGGMTWAISTWVIEISGAGREMTEGFTAVLAALILLSVGLWLHNKSVARDWQQYLGKQMKAAMSGNKLWLLGGLSFIAVYREVFETVLFYRALWEQGQHGAIALGFALAAVSLLVAAWLILRMSTTLPLKQFFAVSGWLIVILSVVFIGKGCAALQEAGVLGVNPLGTLQIPLLGIYPSVQTLGAQLVLGSIAAWVLWRNGRNIG